MTALCREHNSCLFVVSVFECTFFFFYFCALPHSLLLLLLLSLSLLCHIIFFCALVRLYTLFFCTTPLYIRKTAFLLVRFFFPPSPSASILRAFCFTTFLSIVLCCLFFSFSPLVSFPLSSCLCFKIYCFYCLVFLFFLS